MGEPGVLSTKLEGVVAFCEWLDGSSIVLYLATLLASLWMLTSRLHPVAYEVRAL